ncbi:MAG: hypothetical protein ACTSR8_08300 [Promethearchaeota archaeon]
MIRTYIYNSDKGIWLENEYLLMHDLAAFLDDEENMIYIWNGPKSSVERLEQAYESVVELISNMPVENPIQLTILTEDLPPKIDKKLSSMLARVQKEERQELEKFTHILTIRAYFILGLLGIIMPLIHILNSLGSLFWPSVDGYAQVDAEIYNIWILVSIIMMTIALIAYIGIIIISLIEQEPQLFVFALTAIIVCITLIAYFTRGIFLFDFDDTSTSSVYYIAQSQLGIFGFLQLLIVLIILAPNLYKFIKFYSTYRDYLF